MYLGTGSTENQYEELDNQSRISLPGDETYPTSLKYIADRAGYELIAASYLILTKVIFIYIGNAAFRVYNII